MRRLANFIAAFCWLSLFASGVTSLSAADVEVRLTDGRTLRGSVLEDQTSQQQLALEVRSSGIAVRRTLSWKQIATAKIVTRSKREAPQEAPQRQPRSEDEHRGRGETFDDAAVQDSANFTELPLSELIVAAQPVSTFGRMDWDSLRLSVRGFDQTGTPVPLFGTLQVTLWGLREETGRPYRVNTPTGPMDVASQRRLELDRIQTWSRSLDSTIQRLPGIGVPIGGRLGGGGIVYEDVTTYAWSASGFGGQSVTNFPGRQDRGRPVYARNPSDTVQMILPLPRPLLDSDAQRWPIGEVSVELLMPGVGVFYAASPGVALVHQSPLRQELLNQSGSRFFPNETTTESRGFWREPGQPSQLRQITPPFPTAITTNPVPVFVTKPVPVVGPTPVPGIVTTPVTVQPPPP